MFPGQFHVTQEQIIDGTSSTVAFGEVKIGRDFVDPASSYYLLSTGPAVVPNQSNKFDMSAINEWHSQNCHQGDAASQANFHRKNHWWACGQLYRGPLFNMIMPPNTPFGNCGPGTSNITSPGVHSAGSYHAAGAHMTFVDGHAEFIPDTIDVTVYRALGTIANGESTDY